MTTRRAALRASLAGADDGIAASAIILTVAVGVLSLLFIFTIPLLAGTEEASRTQTAADAAALAGALGVRDRAVTEVDDAATALRPSVLSGTHRTWTFTTAVTGGSGFGGAADYAARNGATVEAYSFDPGRDRIQVDARLDELSPDGGPVRSIGVAQVGVELSGCQVAADRHVTGYTTPPTPTPTPTPTPMPTPTPSPTPSPTPTFVPSPIYGPWTYEMTCSGAHGFTLSDADIDDLVDRAQTQLGDLKPRLVS